MAFQLVDDLLDFIATSTQLGKPAAADLRLGLATAPVLFAAQKVFWLDAIFCPQDCQANIRLRISSQNLIR